MPFAPRLATRVSALALAAAVCAPAMAQDVSPPSDSGGQEAEQAENDLPIDIIVTANRLRGSVDTDVPAVVELGEADIASYGADSIADLVAQLSPQVSSSSGRGGGQPVVLVNGQRVASFRELRRYPPEAIEKVEVFPEEVALEYGFRADQRVINFILKDNFSSREVELEYGGPFEGGTDNGEVELSQLFINGPRRINIAAEFNTQSLLTEDERDIVQTPGSQPTVAGDPDPAPFRSLRADSESYELEGSFNTGIGEGADAKAISLNLAAAQNYSRSLSGLDVITLTDGGDAQVRVIDDDPLTRLTRSTSVSGGGSYRQSLGDFEFDLTLDASHVESESDIDARRNLGILQDLVDSGALAVDGPLPAVPASGFDRASSRTTSTSSKSTLRGSPLFLPAGELNMTLAAGYDWTQIVSEDTRSTLGKTVLTRGDINGSANLDVPLASEREGFLGFLGELSLNLRGDVNDLSDFGTLYGTTIGLTWEPLEGLTFQATKVNREAAPGLAQLGDPIVQTFNVPLFDFATGDNVLATLVTGGNPLLPASSQDDLRLSANYQLDLFERTNILFEYNRNRSEDTTESFPLLTAEIEAAFPGRVARDGSGRLVALDQRPITFAERRSERIRYGFNTFGRVGKAQEPGSGGGGPGGPGGGGAARGGAGGSAAGGQGRMSPEQFQQMRDRFCNSEPGAVPDLAALPPFIRERLTNEDGTVNQERLAAARERFCNAEGPGAGSAGGFDPAQAAAIRNTICVAPGGDAPLDISTLPEQLRQRLTNEDGSINEERVARLREAICTGENAQAAQEGGQSEGRRRGGGRRGGGGGREDDGQGRWFLSLYHSVELQNEALVAPGIPVIDYFDLGLAKHTVELEGGVFFKGLGTRVSGRYRSGYTIEGSDPTGDNDLFFGDLVTFDLRFFMNLEEQKWLTGETPGFFKGARVSLGFDNVFNTRQDVVDGTGVTPIRFQPALIDPLGRTFEIEFRKLF